MNKKVVQVFNSLGIIAVILLVTAYLLTTRVFDEAIIISPVLLIFALLGYILSIIFVATSKNPEEEK